MVALTYEILTQLADGKFHSGEQLAQQFNISRARVWQAVDELRLLGLEIAAVTGRGYKIFDGLELLNADKIKSHLPLMAKDCAIRIDMQTTSTNTVLVEELRQKKIGPKTVYFTEYQSQGRGRLGRSWISPIGSNIYCSLTWQFSQGAAQLMGLSLVVGIAIVKALNQLGAKNIGLKWPNDIFWHNKKLGGILVEVAGDALGPCDVVIGMGLNVCMPRAIEIDQAFTDLQNVMQTKISRNQLAALIIASLYEYLPKFDNEGLRGLMDEWLEYDILHQQKVNVTTEEGLLNGIVTGIDEYGQLKVNIAGKEQKVNSAQVSLALTEMN